MKKLATLFIVLFSIVGIAQNSNVYVDDDGVMRWENTNEEVKGFGVNYSVPFAHAYRSAKKLGIDPKTAIENEVYHFTRLGFDLYRLHVWDTQISDVEGNLLENEYLDTFDYLLKTLKDHNINYVITPIAFWGNGWPEPDTETPGFSHKYGKGDCLTNPEAIKAQQNYLFQFLNHVNPYTGVAYKDEPNIIAFEVSNEPHHRGNPEDVTNFVSGMVNAMKRTGTKKPIFYNMSHAVQFMDAYFEGGVDGGTFQWYPTGLGYGDELQGNLLPNVNAYNMPFDAVFKKHKGAKLVYEFDAADVGRSYIYPAMARSFRSAGIQIGTHFAYDPTYLAYANTEYNTHYMNLNYTPQKALALKICSEVFHEVPMYADFVTYPENTTFGDFKIDYKTDLAEYNSEAKFFYTNSTTSHPKNEKSLKEIAGSRNSTLVTYDGTGAYFLDKLDDGIWRLEVQPEAIWVNNPFGRNSLEKTVGVIKWETRNMTINLKDLGNDFSLKAINEGNNFSSEVNGKNFHIRPGTYVLSRKGSSKKWSKTQDFKGYELNQFYAPKTTVAKPWMTFKEVEELSADKPFTFSLQYVAPEQPNKISLVGYNGESRFNLEFKEVAPYQFEVTVPVENLKEGFLNYYILVETNGKTRTYPADKEGNPFAWDFYDRETYTTRVVNANNPIYLFDALEDSDKLVRQWRRGFKLVPTQNMNEAEYQMNIENLFVVDEENLNAEPVFDYSFKHFVIDEINQRQKDLASKNQLVFTGRALNNKPCKLQIALVMDDGSSFGNVIEIGAETKDYILNLSELKPVKTVTLPRPYPSFLPYYFENNNNSKFDVNRVESIQFSIGPEVPKQQQNDAHGVEIIKVKLE